MGLRAVRSMAYSISASIELKVPSTICSTNGFARRNGAALPCELGHLRPFDQSKARDAEIDQLDLLLAGIIVAEGTQMRAVECRDETVEEAFVDCARGRRDPDLHRLAAVT